MSNTCRTSGFSVKPGRLPLLSLGCLLFVVVVLAFSQTPQEQVQPVKSQRPLFTVESDLVVVDVTVRDRKGNLVGDLTRNDFKIFEDNLPQDLVTFSAENVAVGPSPAVVTVPGVPEVAKPAIPVVNLALTPDQPPKKEDLAGKRLVILFFDLSSLSPEDLIRSVETAFTLSRLQVAKDFALARLAALGRAARDSEGVSMPLPVRREFARMAAIKVLAWVRADGYPFIVPALSLQPKGARELVGRLNDRVGTCPQAAPPTGVAVATNVLTAEAISYQAKGRWERSGKTGTVRVQAVYAGGPPLPGARVA